MKWPLAALTLTRTSSTSVHLIALPVPTTPDTGHGAWARATCHPIHAEFARARAILKIAKVLMIRRMLQDQINIIEAGRDPIGVTFDPNVGPVVFEAGNYIREHERE